MGRKYMEAKLDKFGRVLIPKAIRKNLGLKPGQIVHLEESGKEIIIRPNSKTNRVIGGDKGLVEIAEDFDAPLDDFKEYIP